MAVVSDSFIPGDDHGSGYGNGEDTKISSLVMINMAPIVPMKLRTNLDRKLADEAISSAAG